jgi:membrane fusion protein, multidrug efflux system
MSVLGAPPEQSKPSASRDRYANAAPAAVAKRPLLRRPGVVIAAAAVLILGIIYAAFVLFHSFTHESTDDAFIDAHIIAIAPKIAGRVEKVYVNDNQMVKKGDLLVEIDPADPEAVVAQKRASLEVAKARARNAQMLAEQADAHLQTLHAGYEAAGANAAAAAADTAKLKGDLHRNTELVKSGAISRQDYEHSAIDTTASQSNLDSKKKQMDAAAAYLKESEKQAQATHSQADAATAEVAEAEAAERQAELQRSYAKITAPEDGRVTMKAVEPGAYVQVGQNLFALITPQLWVTANFKETQLTEMRPGQTATVTVDAYPGRALPAHVDSIQAGSGARFSLLPPENATGNYVKVVQRVPVKIVLDELPDAQRILGPGMSAVPDVKVKSGWSTAVHVMIMAAIAIAIIVISAAVWIGRSCATHR